MTEERVGWHHGQPLTLDDLSTHMTRWRHIEREVRDAAGRLGTERPSQIFTLIATLPDLLNELDRRRFLLDELIRKGAT